MRSSCFFTFAGAGSKRILANASSAVTPPLEDMQVDNLWQPVFRHYMKLLIRPVGEKSRRATHHEDQQGHQAEPEHQTGGYFEILQSHVSAGSHPEETRDWQKYDFNDSYFNKYDTNKQEMIVEGINAHQIFPGVESGNA